VWLRKTGERDDARTEPVTLDLAKLLAH
jgi:hypothetical protein